MPLSAPAATLDVAGDIQKATKIQSSKPSVQVFKESEFNQSSVACHKSRWSVQTSCFHDIMQFSVLH